MTSTSPRFTAAELDAAFTAFQATVAEIAISRDWDRFAEQFTVDADYIEHALGTMHGREEIREWIWRTMTAFPGSHMTGYPSLWHVVDEERGRVICEVDNPMRDPGDGTAITATNITISPTPATACGAARRTSTTRSSSRSRRCAGAKRHWSWELSTTRHVNG